MCWYRTDNEDCDDIASPQRWLWDHIERMSISLSTNYHALNLILKMDLTIFILLGLMHKIGILVVPN